MTRATRLVKSYQTKVNFLFIVVLKILVNIKTSLSGRKSMPS